MNLLKKTTMEFAGKNYEIRILNDEMNVNAVAFLNNHPANGFRHQVKIPKGFDVNKLLETDVLEKLIEMVKNDITENRWAEFSKIIHL